MSKFIDARRGGNAPKKIGPGLAGVGGDWDIPYLLRLALARGA